MSPKTTARLGAVLLLIYRLSTGGNALLALVGMGLFPETSEM
jgi:hypothetical protein